MNSPLYICVTITDSVITFNVKRKAIDMLFSFRRRVGYNSEIRDQKKWEKMVDKAMECPDCGTMTGKPEWKGNHYLSTCSKCGLMWETKGV